MIVTKNTSWGPRLRSWGKTPVLSSAQQQDTLIENFASHKSLTSHCGSLFRTTWGLVHPPRPHCEFSFYVEDLNRQTDIIRRKKTSKMEKHLNPCTTTMVLVTNPLQCSSSWWRTKFQFHPPSPQAVVFSRLLTFLLLAFLETQYWAQRMSFSSPVREIQRIAATDVTATRGALGNNMDTWEVAHARKGITLAVIRLGFTL